MSNINFFKKQKSDGSHIHSNNQKQSIQFKIPISNLEQRIPISIFYAKPRNNKQFFVELDSFELSKRGVPHLLSNERS